MNIFLGTISGSFGQRLQVLFRFGGTDEHYRHYGLPEAVVCPGVCGRFPVCGSPGTNEHGESLPKRF